MKQRMHGATIALLITFCASQPLSLHAQEDHPLDKTVTLKADHERLEDVLDELAKKGYFTFSYQSDVLKKDRLVTLTIRESTLREALELILGKAYDYLESDDYVIIRPKDRVVRAKTFRQDADDRADPKARTFDADAAPAMKMKIKARTMKRGIVYKTDSLHTYDSMKIVKAKITARYIIDEMIADGIIKDKDSFTWFGLDNGQFVVDGRHLPDSVRVKYAAKFIAPAGNGYYVGTISGIQGRGYFFDKKEIYEDRKE